LTDELTIPRALADQIVAHCEAGRPNEACGLIARSGGELVHVYEMTNASASPVRYSLDTQEQFRVYRELDEKGWELGGVYHSHTRTEAYPSPTDVREAYEAVPYLIVSLAADPPIIRAFNIEKKYLGDAEGEIVEIPVTIR
jgi:proteasome lid subunit RPN8/RPN11